MTLPGIQGNRVRSFSPALLALLVQLVAFTLMFVSTRVAAFELSWIGLAFVQGTLAALLARLLGMASWWLVIEFLFDPHWLARSHCNYLPPGIWGDSRYWP